MFDEPQNDVFKCMKDRITTETNYIEILSILHMYDEVTHVLVQH